MRRTALAVGLALAVGVLARSGNDVGGAQSGHEHGQTRHAGDHAMKHRIAAGVKLVATDDAAKRTVTLRLGPVNLPANSDHMAVAQPADKFWAVPFDGWLVAYHPRLEDAQGGAIPGRVLHHVAFWNTNRSDFLCPNKEEHIFGAGGEMNDWPEVPGFGYPVRKGERVRVETMFHNPTDTAYPGAYLEVQVEYRIRREGESQPKSFYPAWFDVMECRDSGYTLQPGESVTTGGVTVKYDGVLLGVGGHLHDYGQRLVLENVTRKEEVAVLSAELDDRGRIVAMPTLPFYPQGGYRLRAGEQVRTTATYANPTGKALPDGAMGIVVGYFVPDDDADMAALRRKPKKKREAAAAASN